MKGSIPAALISLMDNWTCDEFIEFVLLPLLLPFSFHPNGADHSVVQLCQGLRIRCRKARTPGRLFGVVALRGSLPIPCSPRAELLAYSLASVISRVFNVSISMPSAHLSPERTS
jgi:hypothetical protein